MHEPIDLQSLHQAVQAQSRLLAELMLMVRDGDRSMTPDEGHEMLMRATLEDPAQLRSPYIAPLLAAFPRHSTED